MVSYLTDRLTDDFVHPIWQIICICIAVSLFYVIYELQKERRITPPHVPNGAISLFKNDFVNDFPSIYLWNVEYLIFARYYPPDRDPDAFPSHPVIAFIALAAAASVVFLFSITAACVIAIVALTTSHRWQEADPFVLNIHMNAERISWHSVEGLEQTAPTASFDVKVRVPHKKAAHEAHENQNEIRTAPGNIPISTDNIYQMASELILVSGPENSVVREVIEIRDDQRGEKANTLVHAIRLVREHCLKAARAAAENQSPYPGKPAKAHADAPTERFE